MPDGVLENQIITQTVMTENLFTGLSIGTFQEDFRLCEADFLRLQANGNALSVWAQNVLFAAIGYGMSILPKWISELAGKPEKVTQSEWAVLAAGIVISVVLFAVGSCIPNERKQLLERMAQHFKTAPKTRHIVRGQE